jgi:hypothetical protein
MITGHAPNHIRAAFAEAVEQYINCDGPSPQVDRELWALTGKLWNCTDILPRLLRADVSELRLGFVALSEPEPCTYAQASRILRYRLKREAALV